MRFSAPKARSWTRFCRCARAIAKAAQGLPEGDALRKTLSDFDAKVDAVRKQIVATTEGGAITGEERLREHTDQLYGAILSYEGKPADYQMANIDALKSELDDVTKEFEQLNAEGSPGGERSVESERSTGPRLRAGVVDGGRHVRALS